MKGGNSGNNGSDLDKENILKPTFDTLTEEGRKAFEAYHTNLQELFLSCCEVTRHGTILKDTAPIVFNKPEVIPEVRPDSSSSRNDIQFVIDSALERQANSTDELLHRLIEERDEKKLDATSVNPSSSTCAVSFTQTNPHTSGPSVGDTSMPNLSAQSVNHFHSQTTIEGSTPSFVMPQQTTASMFGQGYTHAAPSFFMPSFTSVPYNHGGNGRAYVHASSSYHALYTTVAYTDPIPLPSSSLDFLHNHTYQNPLQFNAYNQPEVSSCGYETPPQFLFRPQPVGTTPA
jgi:hypothetical protein